MLIICNRNGGKINNSIGPIIQSVTLHQNSGAMLFWFSFPNLIISASQNKYRPINAKTRQGGNTKQMPIAASPMGIIIKGGCPPVWNRLYRPSTITTLNHKKATKNGSTEKSITFKPLIYWLYPILLNNSNQCFLIPIAKSVCSYNTNCIL